MCCSHLVLLLPGGPRQVKALQRGSGHPWLSIRDALLMRGHFWPKLYICGTVVCSSITPHPPRGGCCPPRDGAAMGSPDHLVGAAVECCEHDICLRRAAGGGRSELEETGKRRSWCRGEWRGQKQPGGPQETLREGKKMKKGRDEQRRNGLKSQRLGEI